MQLANDIEIFNSVLKIKLLFKKTYNPVATKNLYGDNIFKKTSW